MASICESVSIQKVWTRGQLTLSYIWQTGIPLVGWKRRRSRSGLVSRMAPLLSSSRRLLTCTCVFDTFERYSQSGQSSSSLQEEPAVSIRWHCLLSVEKYWKPSELLYWLRKVADCVLGIAYTLFKNRQNIWETVIFLWRFWWRNRYACKYCIYFEY